MRPAERNRHILQLVDCLGAVLIVDPEIVCTVGECRDGHGGLAWIEKPFAGAPTLGLAYVSHEPGWSRRAYWTALHELGHLAQHRVDGKWRKAYAYGKTLDREAHAWRWAIEHTKLGPNQYDWAEIHGALASYGNDRRLIRTETFESLLAEAERAAG